MSGWVAAAALGLLAGLVLGVVLARALLPARSDRRVTGEFAQLSAEALRRNSEEFLRLADTKLSEGRRSVEDEQRRRSEELAALLAPLQSQLARYDEGLRVLDGERRTAQATLVAQVRALAESQDVLHRETRNLVTALRSPQTRGRWGELQLRRVCELAGMVEHCDFEEQVSTDGDDGRLRPDLVVHLPGGRNVAVDAKVPLASFLAATEVEDEAERRVLLVDHARQFRAHVDALAKKEYWRRVEPSPEFVVLFVPGDPLLAAALEHQPDLMEHAAANFVLLATPTSLIALLRSVAYGWQQEALADNARVVQQLGAELHQRLLVFADHLTSVGRSLTGAVDSYNKAVGSLESRVLVTARRFSELGAVGATAKPLPDPAPIERATRRLFVAEGLESDGRVPVPVEADRHSLGQTDRGDGPRSDVLGVEDDEGRPAPGGVEGEGE